jgi:hypothetical protein
MVSQITDMAFATKLFRIVVSNCYYKLKEQGGADFNIQPIKASETWMKHRKMRMLQHPDGIELVWLSELYDDPLALLKSKTEGITLSFVLTAKNGRLFNHSEVEVGYPKAKSYYFHNRHKHGSNLLHHDSFVSQSDLLDVHKIASYPTEPGWNVFGIIDIDLASWITQCEKNNKSFSADAIPYEIKLKNRSTFWRYHVIDTKKQLKLPIKVVASGEDTSCFGEARASVETAGTYCIESTKPIGLYDRYDFFFSLCTVDKSKTKQEKVAIEKLPCPAHDSLRQDKSNHQKNYSDIVVYI